MGETDSMNTAGGGALSGRTVVVTRARSQSATLIQALQAHGARVLAFPVIQTVEPDDWAPADATIDLIASEQGLSSEADILTMAAHPTEPGYDWIVFSSTNAVDKFLERMDARGVALKGGSARLAVVGAATADRLQERGLEPDLMPEEFTGEGLADAFHDLFAQNELTLHDDDAQCRFLIPRALKGRTILPDTLRELGCHVDIVPVYRTVPATPDPEVLGQLQEEGADAVTFTSPSTVNNFVEVLASAGVDPEIFLHAVRKASIGPVTTRALQALGMDVEIEAEISTAEGLAGAIVEYFSKG